MTETSATAKIILVLYWGLECNRSHMPIRFMAKYSTKMIFADVSLIIGETDLTV